ncbi:MAG TPA: hypothetical protein P5119_04360 [Candidatus Aminicenantes bacterium]|nr:hypothetical protein [Candidatus Aminicenantes bacterium]HRY64557.1 hypothetical protein [Candidatus Aminicenantes bacterium]HRZ71470.1 hypothetical protein [Candidatus Aminicenantes bacterium]
MKKNAFARRSALAAAAGVVLVLAGCAVKTEPARNILEYRMPAGRVLTYEAKAEQSQVMDIMGQSNDTRTSSTSVFTVKSKSLKDKNFLLGVTIDSTAVTVANSLQGDMSPDMSAVKGKSFDMVLSPLGSEVDVAGAEAITYTISGETHTMASGFKTFFPDVSGKPALVGETWPSSATVEETAGPIKIKVEVQNVNTLEGFETVEGMNCARIATQVTGTLTGSGSQMGMDLSFTGVIKGRDVWYFAVKEGIYVQATSETTTQMSIDVPAAGMTIPATQTSKSETRLTGRK